MAPLLSSCWRRTWHHCQSHPSLAAHIDAFWRYPNWDRYINVVFLLMAGSWCKMMQDIIKTSPDYHRISILGAANQCFFSLRHGWPSHLDQLEIAGGWASQQVCRITQELQRSQEPCLKTEDIRQIWADRAGVDKASAPGHEIPSWDPSRLLKKLLDVMPHTATAQSQKNKMPRVLQKDKI